MESIKTQPQLLDTYLNRALDEFGNQLLGQFENQVWIGLSVQFGNHLVNHLNDQPQNQIWINF